MAKKKPRRGPTASIGDTLPPPSISAAGSQPQRTTGGSSLVRSPSKSTPAPKQPRKKPSSTPTRTPAASTPAPATALPADPMAMLTPAQMQQQATQLAMAQLQPQLNTVNQAQQQGQSAHDTRVTNLTDWGNQANTTLQGAFDDTRTALNQLISLQGGVDKSASETLAAALRSGTGSTDAAAAALGMASPTNLDPALTSAAEANRSAELSIGSGAGNLMGLMGAQRALGPVGTAQSQEVERQRWNAQNQGFTTQRKDLMAQVPGLISASLKDQRDFALAQAQFGEAKANRMFQQYLSEKELNLKTKDQTFQQWLATQTLTETKRSNRAGESQAATNASNQNAVDWANIGINRTQAEAQLAGIQAQVATEKDAKKKEQLKARAAGLSKAMEWLGGYMTPSKGEASPSTGAYPYGTGQTYQSGVKDDPLTPNIDESREERPSSSTYKRLFDDALRGMLNFTTRSDALRILMKSEYPDWRAKATKEYNRLKRRSKPAPSDKGTGGQAQSTWTKNK